MDLWHSKVVSGRSKLRFSEFWHAILESLGYQFALQIEFSTIVCQCLFLEWLAESLFIDLLCSTHPRGTKDTQSLHLGAPVFSQAKQATQGLARLARKRPNDDATQRLLRHLIVTRSQRRPHEDTLTLASRGSRMQRSTANGGSRKRRRRSRVAASPSPVDDVKTTFSSPPKLFTAACLVYLPSQLFGGRSLKRRQPHTKYHGRNNAGYSHSSAGARSQTHDITARSHDSDTHC